MQVSGYTSEHSHIFEKCLGFIFSQNQQGQSHTRAAHRQVQQWDYLQHFCSV